MSETENTSPEQQETQAPDKRRSCKIFLAKAAFTLGTLAVFYGGYLDWQIRSKMDGQIWRLPAEVYSRLESVNLSLHSIRPVTLFRFSM